MERKEILFSLGKHAQEHSNAAVSQHLDLSGAPAEMPPSHEGQSCHQTSLRQQVLLTEKKVIRQLAAVAASTAAQHALEQDSGRTWKANCSFVACSLMARLLSVLESCHDSCTTPCNNKGLLDPVKDLPWQCLKQISLLHQLQLCLSVLSLPYCHYSLLLLLFRDSLQCPPPRFHTASKGYLSRFSSSLLFYQPEWSRSVPEGLSAASTGPDT